METHYVAPSLPGMTKWAERFRAHMRRHQQSQEYLGGLLDPQRTQATIGHWLCGRRKINLEEFLALCEAAGADPRDILFGETSPEAALAVLKTVVATKPAMAHDYKKFENTLKIQKQKSKKPVKAA